MLFLRKEIGNKRENLTEVRREGAKKIQPLSEKLYKKRGCSCTEQPLPLLLF